MIKCIYFFKIREYIVQYLNYKYLNLFRILKLNSKTMCGIAGILYRSKDPNELKKVCSRMIEKIKYRGPDEQILKERRNIMDKYTKFILTMIAVALFGINYHLFSGDIISSAEARHSTDNTAYGEGSMHVTIDNWPQ